ncbi:MAG: N-acetylglucosamine-6-phosphate deacetylase [Actinobacteria bacterium]|nr:N-acetylglucosamine-6-phosphate deacetylase [Actinomycetota bacterium]
MSVTLCGMRLVTEDDVIEDAIIAIEGERVVGVRRGSRPAGAIDLEGALVMAGFVDQHCHGGGQGDFFSADIDQIRTAAATHLAHGTTTIVASLVTATTEDLLAQLAALRPTVADGTIAGVHLEGPWISPQECGAHDITLLRSPDPAEIETLLDAAGSDIAMVTLAPELAGGVAATEQFVDAGVVVAVGHTEADLATTRAAIDSGATVATHLLNRMPVLHKRSPGPVLALMDDPRVVCELIVDGVHIDPEMVRFVIDHVGPDRVAAVTDAMGAAGAPEGRYKIGYLDVEVADGQARLTSDGALAGSVLTLDTALVNLVTKCGQSLPDATRMLSATPARTMGLTDRGRLAAGMRADLVVLDDQLSISRVMRAGTWVSGPQ